MPPQDDQNRIEELKKSLYTRGAPEVRTHRKLRFSDVNSGEVKSAWNEPVEKVEEPVVLNAEYKDHSMSILTKLLIGSVIFCIIAVCAGVYLFFNGANLISGNNISVVISGPVSIPGGEPVTFGIKVTNNNTIDLQLVDMSVAFPPGATNPNDPTQALTTYNQLLGDIPVGQATSTSISAIIFGEENIQKTITATLTYKVKGSSAIFTKVATYDVLINSSPVIVSVDSFISITSGQEFDITVNLKSNSQDVLKNLVLKGDYPFGFTYISSNLPALSDNATWKIGDIPLGGSRSIVIHGKLVGENTDTRVFHFTVGAKSSTNSSIIGTEYGAITQNISIEKPFITLTLGVNGDTSGADIVGKFNTAERMTLTWFNNLSTSVSNVQLAVNFAGTAYDKTGIQPDIGYFDSANNRIIWNQQTNPELAMVQAGGSGSVSFSMVPLGKSSTDLNSNQSINPTISLSANVSADRTQDTGASGSLTATVNRLVKVASNVSLSGRVERSVGPFTNSGPIPPKAEQKTTYTISWIISNTTSSVSNAEVTATLPPYVTWLGNVSPTNENITYDPNSGAITWNAGTVTPNASMSSTNRREVDFQVSLQPSITQVGTSPTLVNQASLTATDDFTQAQLSSQQDYLTSSYSTDPVYKGGDETVVQ